MFKALALTLLLPVAATSALNAQNAFLVDSDLDQLFSVDLVTGAANLIASTANNGLDTPADLTWDVATSRLWTIDLSGGEVGTIDVTNGTFAPVYQTGQSGWQAIVWDPTTQKFYLNNQTNPDLYVLDPATGTTTLVGDTGQGLITAMAIDANGQLWGTDFSSGALVTIDKNTAAATVIGGSTSGFQGACFSPTGQLFATNTNDDSLHTIDTTTGVATLVGAHGAGVQFAKGFAIAGGGSNYARAQPYGSGCGGSDPSSFYELFSGSHPFDLANSGFTMFATPGGYIVAPVTNPIVTPATPSLGLADDVTVPVALPFAFPYAGGSTNSLWLCSNGWISFEATTSTALTESAAGLVSGTMRVCPMWDDLNPNAGGSVHAEVDPFNAGLFHVTFLGVPEYSVGGSNDFQISIDSNGNIEFKYGVCSIGDCLVGFSPGHNVRDPGPIDISAAVPGAFGLGDDRPDLSLVPITRPVVGQTGTVQTRDIPAGSLAAFALVGFSPISPPVDLTPFGMPGCSLYVNSAAAAGLTINGTTADFSLLVPNIPGIAGQHLYIQTGSVSPIANALGVAMANGMDWTMDVN